MKFGLFYELSAPHPHSGASAHKTLQEALEQVRLADEVGFGYVWVVEHHFLNELSVSSAPDLFLTAAAVQTQQIHLGHGIVICVPEVNHPVRLAERAAMLDLLSGGRLEFGTGRSTTWSELGGFGADPDKTKDSWDEYVRTIPKMWTQDRFEYDGDSYWLPQRSILPKPYQTPHPPMWVAVTSKGTEIDAAERGLGALVLSFAGISDQKEKIDRYRERIKTAKPVGSFINNQVGLVNFLFCHEDEEYAITTGRKLATFYQEIAGQNFSVKEIFPTSAYVSNLPSTRLRAELAAPGAKIPPGLCVGTPEQIRQALRSWQELGVDSVNFLINMMDIIPQQDVLDSISLFAREVMPEFDHSVSKKNTPVEVTL